MTTVQTSPEGPVVRGAPQDEHTFVGVMHASQLFAFAPDPIKLESVAKGTAREPDIEALSPVRVDVQRMFEGAKRRNVPSYADYIKRLHRGQIDGATPIIELWCEAVLPDGSGPYEKILPWGTQFIAIDGEMELTRSRGHLSIGGVKPPMRSPHAEKPTALPARVSRGSG